MTKFQKRLTTAIATGAVLVNALAPLAFAETSITVSGNGTSSDNTANVSTTTTTTVNQNNTANITNNVSVTSNTGGNDANDNTGGDTSVTTGGATTDVAVSNQANSNSATVDSCSTCNGGATVDVSGNGSFSDNTVRLNQDNNTTVRQDNRANFTNNVSVQSNTGYNDANRNTGGDVSVRTGDTDTTVTVENAANANTAVLGAGTGGTGDITARILGNGTESDNRIVLDGRNTTRIDQRNTATINNNIAVSANTGRNDANDNTGGDVEITTGDAVADIAVENMANFNAADVDNCGCLGDLTAKILGNGSFSDNTIRYNTDNRLDLGQRNDTRFTNNVGCEAATGAFLRQIDGRCGTNTGDNDANRNTGAVLSAFDPTTIDTGSADTTVYLSNEGNVNDFGSGLTDLGDWLSHHLSFHFDFGGLLSMFS